MGLDQYLHLSRGYKIATKEERAVAGASIERTENKEQYEKSIKEISRCEAEGEGEWCEWDKRYVKKYNEYQKRKHDKVLCLEFTYWRKDWPLHNYMKKVYMMKYGIPLTDPYWEFNNRDVELEKEDIQEVIMFYEELLSNTVLTEESTQKDKWAYDDIEYNIRNFKEVLEQANFEEDYVIYSGNY